MDGNGTRFHLLRGAQDWQRCGETPETAGLGPSAAPWQNAGWDAANRVVTLTPQLPLFRHRKRQEHLTLDSRRDAAADANGNWFWISQDRSAIYWLPSGTQTPAVYWNAQKTNDCPPGAVFAPVAAAPPVPPLLRGLAITEGQYLVAGNRVASALQIFDLRTGGPPQNLPFPAGMPFAPFTMTAAPGGGLWILDRDNKTYCGLDAQFRFLGQPPAPAAAVPPAAFQPSAGGSPAGGLAGQLAPSAPCIGTSEAGYAPPPVPQGFPVAASDPVSIQGLPDGSVLILDSPGLAAGDQVSLLWHYRSGASAAPPLPLHADLEIAVEGQEETVRGLDVVGYDMAYLAENQTIYIVERDGTQVIAFQWPPVGSPPALAARADYLPLHFFGARALTPSGGQAFYDVVGGDPAQDDLVHWLPLQSIEQPRYERDALLFTPPFDSREKDCVWHRLFLDACIPAETAARISTRAHNDLTLLATAPFTPEPDLYLRGAGTELAFYDPFPGETAEPGKGAWELLFQKAQGRYLQIQIELSGSGRASPELTNLRAYYPRFSYPRHYLPAVYQEDAESADFLERLLANMEGFYSDIEGKIRDVGILLDPRAAPPEALDWLAGWVGVALDPIWADLQQRRQQAQSASSAGMSAGQAAPDRRRLFLRFARLLYTQRGTVNGMLLALNLLLDPCLEATFALMKQAATAPVNPPVLSPDANDPAQARQVAALRAALTRLNLPLPNSSMRDADLEDLLAALLLSPNRASQVRIVERFRTRGGRSGVEGDPNGLTSDDSYAATAHRFSVLIPVGLMPEEEAMVNRLVNLEKPAHTQFVMGRYFDLFLAGQARLGIDTILGDSSRFAPMLLGAGALAGSYLPPAPPFDAPDRIIVNRDRVGVIPSL